VVLAALVVEVLEREQMELPLLELSILEAVVVVVDGIVTVDQPLVATVVLVSSSSLTLLDFSHKTLYKLQCLIKVYLHNWGPTSNLIISLIYLMG
jgi:hypothetical protein